MATSGLKDAVNSILTQMGAIPFDWATTLGTPNPEKNRPTYLFQLVRLWNDQVNREKAGTGYLFAKPACFLEIENMSNESLLDNVTMGSYIFKLHIVDMQLDDAEGNMDQNLDVITYRDATKQAMAGFTPTNCSTLFAVNEHQDYEHDDVYHYVLDTSACFVDTKGSFRDPDQTQFVTKEPPTDAELNIQFEDEPPELVLEIVPTM